jgi:SH3 domain-containing YSC84-like protein 1
MAFEASSRAIAQQCSLGVMCKWEGSLFCRREGPGSVPGLKSYTSNVVLERWTRSADFSFHEKAVMKKILLFVMVSIGGAPMWAQTKATNRLDAATEVLNAALQTSDKGIPQKLLSNAECIVVIPGSIKGGFIVGAKYGRGFFSCRKEDNVGWSAPGAMMTEGMSVGFQIGGATTDIVMLVMNRHGANRLLSSQFTLGGEASVAAGPIGRDSQAATDVSLQAEILTYSRQRGAFGGLSLQGATLREDDQTNLELYGHKIRNKEVVLNTTPVPAAAGNFIATLNKYSSRK